MISREPIGAVLGKELAKLYDENVKHGNYQPVPEYLLPYISPSRLAPLWRDPRPRLVPIFNELDIIPDSTIIEIGANSGYQSLFLARNFPRHNVVAVEGSSGHSRFIKACAEYEGLNNLSVINDYVTPGDLFSMFPESVVLDFNVAHHIGSDINAFNVHDVDSWWDSGIAGWLSGASDTFQYWFQCGYRLGGNLATELHNPGDPRGFILRILELSPFDLGHVKNLWCFRDTPPYLFGDDSHLSALRCELDEINDLTNEGAKNGEFVGEYFRRPLIQFVARADGIA